MNTKVTKREMFSDKPEIEYSSLIPYDERKNRAVFTPFQIAEFMSEWIVSNDKCKTILDPAVGLGIFFRVGSNTYGILLLDFFYNFFNFVHTNPLFLSMIIFHHSRWYGYENHRATILVCPYYILTSYILTSSYFA
ncbi:hypothetical protein M1M92_02310 [Peptococcaceae bacterium]|nr:hypothetical protein [Peptococcaceae bacterium]